VNGVRTVAELEQTLRTAEPEQLQPRVLSDIRSRGRRRRRGRMALVAATTAAAVVAVSLGVSALTGGAGERADDEPPVAHQPPKEMSALARRALAEIPGAVQVSSWQVVIPLPAGAGAGELGIEGVPRYDVKAGPVDVDARWYTGVTTFRPKGFPAWLHDGIADYEQHVLGDEDGYPVGSTDIGVLVDGGPLRLACTSDDSHPCAPSMLSGGDGDLVYRWGMGTEDFLLPGSDMELFDTATYTTGSPRTVWIGGVDGADVASVDLVTTDGETLSATVAAGTFVPGDTIFWGTVDGELARVVTRDADGHVVEDHEVEPCSDPVDCEVR
jgi:hypothetical protein